MSTGARLLAILLGLLAAAAALFALGLGFGLVAEPGRWSGQPIAAAVGAGLLLAALLLLFSGLRVTKKALPETVLQSSEYGEIRIAIVAMENMVLRVVQQTQGVKDGGCRVYQSNEGLAVQIKVKVMPDLELPGLVSGLQMKVKTYLEQITGIIVHDVKVVVENIILDQAPARKLIRPS